MKRMRTHAILCLIILFAAGCGTYPDPEAEKNPSVIFQHFGKKKDKSLKISKIS